MHRKLNGVGVDGSMRDVSTGSGATRRRNSPPQREQGLM
jgi:hypothetical protein